MTIPRHPEDVTAEWLSAVLGGDLPVTPSAVEVVAVGTGQTGATYRVSVTYAEDSALPDTFVIKLPDRKSTRLNSSHSGESRMPSSA